MNKIRVIDLLNKIANGEEVPKKIKLDDLIYTYQEDGLGAYDYYCIEVNKYLMDMYNMLRNVNYEIEIISEQKKIEKLEINNGNKIGLEINGHLNRDSKELVIAKKINEIIDKINEGE